MNLIVVGGLVMDDKKTLLSEATFSELLNALDNRLNSRLDGYGKINSQIDNDREEYNIIFFKKRE